MAGQECNEPQRNDKGPSGKSAEQRRSSKEFKMNEMDIPGYQNEIAVIGMACRLPGARNIQEFWQNLCGSVESISFFPDQELLSAGADPAVLSDPNYVKASGVLRDIDLFDASFFGFTPRKAESTNH